MKNEDHLERLERVKEQVRRFLEAGKYDDVIVACRYMLQLEPEDKEAAALRALAAKLGRLADELRSGEHVPPHALREGLKTLEDMAKQSPEIAATAGFRALVTGYHDSLGQHPGSTSPSPGEVHESLGPDQEPAPDLGPDLGHLAPTIIDSAPPPPVLATSLGEDATQGLIAAPALAPQDEPASPGFTPLSEWPLWAILALYSLISLQFLILPYGSVHSDIGGWPWGSAYHLHSIEVIFPSDITGYYTMAAQPPLNTWYTYAFLAWFGFHDYVLKVSQFMCGVATFIALYVLIRRFDSRLTASLALLALVLNPLSIWTFVIGYAYQLPAYVLIAGSLAAALYGRNTLALIIYALGLFENNIVWIAAPPLALVFWNGREPQQRKLFHIAGIIGLTILITGGWLLLNEHRTGLIHKPGVYLERVGHWGLLLDPGYWHLVFNAYVTRMSAPFLIMALLGFLAIRKRNLVMAIWLVTYLVFSHLLVAIPQITTSFLYMYPGFMALAYFGAKAFEIGIRAACSRFRTLALVEDLQRHLPRAAREVTSQAVVRTPASFAYFVVVVVLAAMSLYQWSKNTEDFFQPTYFTAINKITAEFLARELQPGEAFLYGTIRDAHRVTMFYLALQKRFDIRFGFLEDYRDSKRDLIPASRRLRTERIRYILLWRYCWADADARDVQLAATFALVTTLRAENCNRVSVYDALRGPATSGGR